MERMVSLRGDQEQVLARSAPHILGVTLAEHADRAGDFTQTTYFSSEQDARRAEQAGSPNPNEPALQELRSLMADLRSFDLRDPQLLSPTNAPTYWR